MIVFRFDKSPSTIRCVVLVTIHFEKSDTYNIIKTILDFIILFYISREGIYNLKQQPFFHGNINMIN